MTVFSHNASRQPSLLDSLNIFPKGKIVSKDFFLSKKILRKTVRDVFNI